MLKGVLRRFAGFGAAAVAAAFILPLQSQAAEPIKIGTTLSVTGPASFLGDPELKTLEIYIKQINKDGGVLGRPVKLVAYDDGGQVQKARSFVKRLIDEDKVDVIVGGSTSGVSMAVIPLVEKARIPFISLAGAEEIVSPVKKWVFKTPQTDRMAAQRIFQDMKSRGITKIGLISSTSGFGKSGHKVSLEEAPHYGIQIVADETYGPKDSDMTAQLTKIKNTPGVQAVLNFDFGQGPAIVAKNFKELGFKVPLYESHGVASQKFIDLAGSAAEGIRLPAAALVVADQLPANDPQKAVEESYKKTFESATHSPVSAFGGEAYDGLQIALAAIQRAGSTDKAKVRDEIEKTNGFMGTSGVVHMSPTDHLGLSLAAFRMIVVHNGHFELLK